MKKIILFFVCLLLLVACATEETGNTSETNATFIRVVDGDTILASIEGKEEYVRLLLIDTPETKRDAREIQPYGPEASALLGSYFTEGDSIYLEYGTERRDQYDRVLAYLYTQDGEMINEHLLEEGLARVAYVFPPNDKYANEFLEIEKEARQQEIGIWSIDGYVTERGFNEGVTPIKK